MVVGIDPSFSRTGISIRDRNGVRFYSVSASEKGVYNLEVTFRQAAEIADKVVKTIKACEEVPKLISQEYPVLASRPGGILGILMTCLVERIQKEFPDCTYYLVPSMAILSVTKCKTKAALVQWVKDNSSLCSQLSFNHDEASAFVLSLIGVRIKNKTYKNTKIILHE